MNQRPWQRALARTGGTLVLFAVPALALAWFSPSAWSALAAGSTQTSNLIAQGGVDREQAVAISMLDEFAETAHSKRKKTAASPAVQSVLASQKTVARATSTELNNAINNYLKLLPTLTNANAIQLAARNLIVLNTINKSFSTFYKTVSGTNTVGNATKVGLASVMVSANIDALNLQTVKDTQSGSVSTFTPTAISP